MRYRNLGHSGTAVSVLALGTMTFGHEADEEASFAILDAFVEAGGNLVDTADRYSMGVSEEIIGRWLAAHPAGADQLVLATKARFPMGQQGPNDHGLSRRYLARALDASLSRLGVERIDLYQAHAWDALTPVEETLRFYADAISDGKIAYYGFSNVLGWQLTKIVHTARALGLPEPVTLQPQYNLLVRGIEHEIVPAALDAGIGLLPWSPLGGGWLSGKYRRDEPPQGATRLGEDPQRGMEAWAQRNGDPRTWAVLDAVASVAQAHGASFSQVALAWLDAQPAVTSVILGARTTAQLGDNLGALDVELTDAELAALNEAAAPQVEDYPYGAPGVAQRERKIAGGR